MAVFIVPNVALTELDSEFEYVWALLAAEYARLACPYAELAVSRAVFAWAPAVDILVLIVANVVLTDVDNVFAYVWALLAAAYARLA